MLLDPRDQLRFYQLPKWSTVAVSAAGAVSVATADPARVAIIFSIGAATTAALLSTDQSKLAASVGMGITTQVATLMISHVDFPGLPQAQWFALGAGSITLTVGEVRLQSTPEEILHVETEFQGRVRSGPFNRQQTDYGLLTQKDYAAILRAVRRSSDSIERPRNGARQRDHLSAGGGDRIPQAVGRWRYGATPVVRPLRG